MATSCEGNSESVRKRRPKGASAADAKFTDSISRKDAVNTIEGTKKGKKLQSLQTGTFWLTRIVLLRSVAFIYCECAGVSVNIRVKF